MCLKEDFVITNQDEAQLLFEAIETVIQIIRCSMIISLKITKTPNGWQLIDSEIFDDKKDYVIETTPQGKVTRSSAH